ncbi:MAG: sulfurtransferase TusA family protein [Nitrospirales bacterium]|nr:sulfurtransferase TusA family protein [Nitrospirales bacterium]
MVIVDTRGLACPMPVLNTKRALAKIEAGQILKVIATDFGSESDIPVLVKRLGHELVAASKKDEVFTFLIRKR